MSLMSSRRRAITAVSTALLSASLLAACGGSDDSDAEDDSIVAYVGRDEELISPLIEQFTEQTGVKVEARYAATPEMAATLLEEGDNTPADVFISQDAGALGALSDQGMLRDLPEDVAGAVFPEFTSTDGSWVGLTGRSRVFAYDSEKLDADEVPDAVEDFVGPEWKGRVGFPPGNASFQSFVTGFRVAKGDDAARTWLEGMKDNDAQIYENNLLSLEAVNEGTLDVALTNHYYWFETAAEIGEDNMRAQLKFAEAGDPGALVNVSGAGVLSDDPDAVKLARYLTGEDAQRYFAEKTFEYPLIEGVDAPEGLPALTDLAGPEIDLADLADLEASVAMIEDAGLS